MELPDGAQMTKRKLPGKPLQLAARRRIVILGLVPVVALDVIGPAEVFTLANRLSGSHPPPYILELVCSGSDLNLQSETGIALTAHRTLEQERRSSKPIDTLVVTAGFSPEQSLDRTAIEWIRTRSRTVKRVCSICVGAFALADAGLLDGRRATTHWGMARRLGELYPAVRVDANPIWIKDGNVYTSAGISAGIDLALALVGEDLGSDIALEIAKNLVLFLQRPGGQAQFSVSLQAQHGLSSKLEELRAWITEHLHTDLTVEVLADKSATSVRTLIRVFEREFGTTPAKYVEEARLEAVCRALELGGRSLEEIARRCGYRSVDVLRKAFVRRLGVSPKEYSQRFSIASAEA